jgi:hypothetical protein
MLSTPDDTKPFSLGFLAVVEHELYGLFGGYLLLNVAGRPLSFHCTAPIKPNRAQQILYGPTLEPYLYGEQIGATLVNASQQLPQVIFVDQLAALALRQNINLPTALVAAPSTPGNVAAHNSTYHSDDDHPLFNAQIDFLELIIGQNRLLVPRRFAADRESIAQRLSASDDWFDFSEPFQRIRMALQEAQRVTSKAA